ncbi:MAG: chromate transporter, partial [Oscillospiraceae bacterium]|nr:chromate transporter [Oscillospiraceae bacterium]
MTLLRLFFEVAKVGLFSVGGGLGTIPFLKEMGENTGWFTNVELTTMIAVSESTPGPIGVNMATYVGFETAGLPGAVTATLGLIFPSIVVILIIAGFLQKFRQSQTVDAVFRGLRPASTALITSAGLGVAVSEFLSTSAGGAMPT